MASVPVVVSCNLIVMKVVNVVLYACLERFRYHHVTSTHLEERQILGNMKRHIGEPV